MGPAPLWLLGDEPTAFAAYVSQGDGPKPASPHLNLLSTPPHTRPAGAAVGVLGDEEAPAFATSQSTINLLSTSTKQASDGGSPWWLLADEPSAFMAHASSLPGKPAAPQIHLLATSSHAAQHDAAPLGDKLADEPSAFATFVPSASDGESRASFWSTINLLSMPTSAQQASDGASPWWLLADEPSAFMAHASSLPGKPAAPQINLLATSSHAAHAAPLGDKLADEPSAFATFVPSDSDSKSSSSSIINLLSMPSSTKASDGGSPWWLLADEPSAFMAHAASLPGKPAAPQINLLATSSHAAHAAPLGDKLADEPSAFATFVPSASDGERRSSSSSAIKLLATHEATAASASHQHAHDAAPFWLLGDEPTAFAAYASRPDAGAPRHAAPEISLVAHATVATTVNATATPKPEGAGFLMAAELGMMPRPKKLQQSAPPVASSHGVSLIAAAAPAAAKASASDRGDGADFLMAAELGMAPRRRKSLHRSAPPAASAGAINLLAAAPATAAAAPAPHRREPLRSGYLPGEPIDAFAWAHGGKEELLASRARGAAAPLIGGGGSSWSLSARLSRVQTALLQTQPRGADTTDWSWWLDDRAGDMGGMQKTNQVAPKRAATAATAAFPKSSIALVASSEASPEKSAAAADAAVAAAAATQKAAGAGEAAAEAAATAAEANQLWHAADEVSVARTDKNWRAEAAADRARADKLVGEAALKGAEAQSAKQEAAHAADEATARKVRSEEAQQAQQAQQPKAPPQPQEQQQQQADEARPTMAKAVASAALLQAHAARAASEEREQVAALKRAVAAEADAARARAAALPVALQQQQQQPQQQPRPQLAGSRDQVSLLAAPRVGGKAHGKAKAALVATDAAAAAVDTNAGVANGASVTPEEMRDPGHTQQQQQPDTPRSMEPHDWADPLMGGHGKHKPLVSAPLPVGHAAQLPLLRHAPETPAGPARQPALAGIYYGDWKQEVHAMLKPSAKPGAVKAAEDAVLLAAAKAAPQPVAPAPAPKVERTPPQPWSKEVARVQAKKAAAKEAETQAKADKESAEDGARAAKDARQQAATLRRQAADAAKRATAARQAKQEGAKAAQEQKKKAEADKAAAKRAKKEASAKRVVALAAADSQQKSERKQERRAAKLRAASEDEAKAWSKQAAAKGGAAKGAAAQGAAAASRRRAARSKRAVAMVQPAALQPEPPKGRALVDDDDDPMDHE